MSATTPAGVSMHDLLAACAAAEAVSRPPRSPEHPEEAEGRGARGNPQPAENPEPHPRAAA
ncbi:hypothetical protein [Streptomyces alanosinicus]|nr:hypothetical protein [Streptomyces alanosinicus]